MDSTDAPTPPDVDTEPSGSGFPGDPIPAEDEWTTTHRLDALCAIYKSLCEGYGARTGRSETADAAIQRLEAVIHGMVMKLPIPPTETKEEIVPEDDITGPDNDDA